MTGDRLAPVPLVGVVSSPLDRCRETARSILQHCRESLAPYKRIRRLEFHDLPKTVSGKIRRVELRRREADVHPDGGSSPAAVAPGGAQTAVEYTDAEGNTVSIPADSVVMSTGMRATTDLALSFYGCAKEFYMIGDCKKAATIQQGMRHAYAVAHRI